MTERSEPTASRRIDDPSSRSGASEAEAGALKGRPEMTDLGLEERLARLEARVRRMRVVGFTVLVIAITIALGATLPGVPRTLVTYVGRHGRCTSQTIAGDVV